MKYNFCSPTETPTVIIIFRDHCSINNFKKSLQSGKSPLHNKIAWSCWNEDKKYGVCESAIFAFNTRSRQILAVTENCLCGIYLLTKKTLPILQKITNFFNFSTVDPRLLRQSPDHVIWFDNPSFAYLFFRKRFYNNVKIIHWIYRNQNNEDEVLCNLMRLYHEVFFCVTLDNS